MYAAALSGRQAHSRRQRSRVTQAGTKRARAAGAGGRGRQGVSRSAREWSFCLPNGLALTPRLLIVTRWPPASSCSTITRPMNCVPPSTSTLNGPAAAAAAAGVAAAASPAAASMLLPPSVLGAARGQRTRLSLAPQLATQHMILTGAQAGARASAGAALHPTGCDACWPSLQVRRLAGK
jgi:hypothetical protein